MDTLACIYTRLYLPLITSLVIIYVTLFYTSKVRLGWVRGHLQPSLVDELALHQQPHTK